MLNQNADPHLTYLIQNADLDQINQALILRLVKDVCEHNHHINALKQEHQEILLRLDNLEKIAPHLIHLELQKEELENRLAFLEPPD